MEEICVSKKHIDFLTDYQLCDRLCDGDIYRYEVGNVPPSWGVHVES